MPAKPSVSARQIAFRVAVQAAFPDVFHPDSPKPLTVGVHKQLKEAMPDASMSLVRDYLRRWTRRPNYFRAVANNEYRYNIDGSQSEVLDPDHRQQAAQKLEKLAQRSKDRPPRSKARTAGSSARTGRPASAGRRSGAAKSANGRPQSQNHAQRTTPVVVIKKRRVVAPTA